ncbi:MAG: DUF4435 domain-containing protein [Aphanothece saxicola GSE-SYN-MK-01-06B]|jgi:hypothetical protein|nr:DUF4435 domain-containing protein [Aphanothece saxicola GSE-SYN-MK-01-06B]
MSGGVDTSFIQVHEQALADVDEVYHAFLLLYRASDKCVYGICEGKDDPTFYQSLIEGKLPGHWQVKIIPAGGKKKVIQAYHAFNWHRFSKNQICFFIDRDLDDYLGRRQQQPGDNVYITDGYSIENSIYDCKMLLNVLSDIYQITLLSAAEEEVIVTLIAGNLEAFSTSMIPLMAQILLWRRAGILANLNNLKLEKIFKFTATSIVSSSRDLLLSTAAKHIGSPLNTEAEIASAEQEIAGCVNLPMLIRGKYITWFMVRQCEALWKDITAIIQRFTCKPKKRIEFSEKIANVIFAPRARIPASLCGFLDATYIEYINSRESSRLVRG